MTVPAAPRSFLVVPSTRLAPGAAFLVWAALGTTALALVGPGTLLGFGASGVAWLIALLTALLGFLFLRSRVAFPFWLWIPWAAVVVTYLVRAEEAHALQRSVMVLCPVLVGISASKIRAGENELVAFFRGTRALAVILIAIVVIESGILVTGALPAAMGLAAGSMTAALLATVFAAAFACGDRAALVWWTALCTVPVVALTRMGMLATGITLPLTFAPMRLRTRVVLLGVAAIAGLAVFQTERVQRKMFFSGSGTLEDVARDNSDFSMSGRRGIWDALQAEIAIEPWFGHGANASERFVAELTGGIAHPHNDWLRLLYEYGYVGTSIFALTILAQTAHLLAKARRATGLRRRLFYAGASSFVVFALFMTTDNIVLYAAFFGNLQFALLGLAYGTDGSPSATLS